VNRCSSVRSIAAVLALLAGCSRASSDPQSGAPQAPPPDPLPPGHGTSVDTTPKEGPRVMAAETYIRSYLRIFGGLAPLDAQKALTGTDGPQLFNAWDDYLGALGLPDYRYDVPRLTQTNTLMLATFERAGVALCDRALEHDRTMTPHFVFDFDVHAPVASVQDFAPRFDILHRTFLGYPAALAQTDRVTRFYQLWTNNAQLHAAAPKDAGVSRFTSNEAAWAAVCYGLVRHPEFHTY
jgi:hypothetical protein